MENIHTWGTEPEKREFCPMPFVLQLGGFAVAFVGWMEWL